MGNAGRQAGVGGSPDRHPGLGRQFNIYVGLAYIVFAVLMVVAVNMSQRSLALEEARQKSRILLDRNLATHYYFTKELKPAVFPLAARSTDEKRYFEPTWMSSTYAVRRINDYFEQLGEGNAHYYYKECAINARSPGNEANAIERAFIEKLGGNPRLTESTAVRTIDGNRFFVVLRRGEMMEKACLRCHSVPEAAPSDLVARYGPTRSFGRKEGEVVTAISIRIPLEVAYARANELSMKLAGILLVGLMSLFGVQIFVSRRFLQQRRELEEARENVRTLSGFLPICASCKKIRDDAGYWESVESYITKHSEAVFSHGICEECLEKLYPGYGPEK